MKIKSIGHRQFRAGATLGILALFAGGTFAGGKLAADEPRVIDFNRDIRPILSNNCFSCHGPDAAERKGGSDGLRLDTPEGAREDLGGYFAIVPGKPQESALVERILSSNADELMPPPATGKKLSDREKKLIAEWIQQGAAFARHWSYQAPVRPALPAVTDASWPRNAIDFFLLSRLDREGLRPTEEADRYTLIRRLSLDLTGVPPTLDEIDAFVSDPDPQAYENLVERLLSRPAFGEHWAHMWLDLARYADSAGYADDPPRTIWLYRDYVIRALNANLPFDRFTIEQIAGDLLPGATLDQQIATAFHRNTLTNNEGGTNDEEFRNVAIVDRVNTTMAVWMGTTMACAQCHSHKYDPISQTDYFRFFAIFNNTDDADRRDESPLVSRLTETQEVERGRLQTEIARAEQVLQTPTPEIQAAQLRWEAAFPRDLKWQELRPTQVKSAAGSAVSVAEDASISVAGGAKSDTYQVELPGNLPAVRAVRLEVLPDDKLPGAGPGHAGGNFIVTGLSAVVTPPPGSSLGARYVRIELPGKERMVSLAEVQVFQEGRNLAIAGTASQSSTDFQGEARLAIDGNTDGHYFDAKSTTHTAISENPWWEVDLKSEQPIDRVVIWNRTDNNTGSRLAGYKVLVLDDKRQPVWQQTPADVPAPNSEFSLSGERALPFDVAVADYSQAGFESSLVLNNKDPKQKGWAIGGQTGRSHSLVLIAKTPASIPEGARWTLTIDQQAQLEGHTLGRFRVSVTADDRAEEWARTPETVLTALRLPAADRSVEQGLAIAAHFRSFAPELQPARQRLADLQKQLAAIQPITVPVMKELEEGKRRVTRIQHRGNFLDLGDEVTEATLSSFHPLPPDARPDRLGLARWLVDSQNPLTPRVIANRYWEQIFGVGIVATSEEFGAQGDLPYHPELLDWLATELPRSEWDIKAFLRLLVTSAAYRQSSRAAPELVERDPDNRLLARGPRFRLSAETVRDQALGVSGLLVPRLFGPPVKPPQPAMGVSAAFGSGIDWSTSDGADRYRRALYTTWRRSNPYPSMSTFDAPNREVCTLRRVRTNTPLQALVTLNDPVFVEAAQALARRVISEGGPTTADRARLAFRLCLARPPHPEEESRLVKLFEQTYAAYQKQPEQAQKMATEPLGKLADGADVAAHAAWTVVGNVLLNLDETLMKR